jgi:uncharacterized protein YndB with AHSA1/START domain
MPDILHKVEVKASPEQAYAALATNQGLSGWWTTDTRGDFEVGGGIQFRFGTRGSVAVKILQLQPNQRVTWQVTEGPAAWIGSTIDFELEPAGDYTAILFKHQGWKEPSEMMHHCSTKWALFLMSIKSLVETGSGAPYPRDVHISGSGD